jgi:hypothetical protein
MASFNGVFRRLGFRWQPFGDFAHQIGDALAMLGRNRQRLAQPERPPVQRRVGAHAALGLVGNQQHRPALAT